jgi:hypothetical protein
MKDNDSAKIPFTNVPFGEGSDDRGGKLINSEGC